MGNRAVITFDGKGKDTPALYVHWNGGRDSIEGFALATKILMATRGADKHYAMARFAQVVGTFFDGNLSYGMGQLKNFGTEDVRISYPCFTQRHITNNKIGAYPTIDTIFVDCCLFQRIKE
jgi:hypothetical protein